uniref:Uncharacterized protein n=1 Tax=Zea mays TaxID=4577 RepID=B8A2E2_MAIZE|nr:unknown [Zea mays]
MGVVITYAVVAMPWAPHRPSASSLCSPVSLPPCAHHAGRRSQPSTLPSPGRGGLRSSSASPSTESPRPCAATCSPRPCQGLLRTPTSSPSPATVSKVVIHNFPLLSVNTIFASTLLMYVCTVYVCAIGA